MANLDVLGAGYDERRGIFVNINVVGRVNPAEKTPVSRAIALDLIRGLAAAIQQDDLTRERTAARTKTAPEERSSAPRGLDNPLSRRRSS